ncbi:MAG: cell division protein FtsQ [Ilumatobacter sp.]|jgi:cell division protein FtsQ
MSRWRRTSRSSQIADSQPVSGFSDVRIVGPKNDESDVLAELSQAFDDDANETDDSHGIDGGGDVTKPLTENALTTIAIGGDDDIPDAVYLDDELGQGGTASDTVFIDDDLTGDTVLAKDATARGIEPRLRQRRIGVRRAEGRRRLKWAAIISLVAVVAIGALATLGSSLFAVDDVDVTGQQFADADAVTAVIDDLLGRPVLLVDTDAAEAELERIPFVESARVRSDFPSSVTIELRERAPVAATVGADGRFRILDAEGRVLDVIGGQPIAFVLITSSTTLDLEAGQFAESGYAAASAMVTKLTPEVRSRLRSMSIVPDGSDLRFILLNEPGNDIEVRLGAAITDNDQIERLVRLQRVLDDVEGSDTTVIDVSTAETTER